MRKNRHGELLCNSDILLSEALKSFDQEEIKNRPKKIWGGDQ